MKRLRLFHIALKPHELEPEALQLKLSSRTFDGYEGFSNFERVDEFEELRFNYLVKLPRRISVLRLVGEEIRKENVELESLGVVELHIRSSGLVEAYGNDFLIAKAIDKLSELGEITEVVFDQKDFEKVARIAKDVRKVRVYGVEDPRIAEIIYIGSGLRVKGKVRELWGKMEVNGKGFSFAMDSFSIRFFGKVDQSLIEAFIDMLLF